MTGDDDRQGGPEFDALDLLFDEVPADDRARIREAFENDRELKEQFEADRAFLARVRDYLPYLVVESEETSAILAAVDKTGAVGDVAVDDRHREALTAEVPEGVHEDIMRAVRQQTRAADDDSGRGVQHEDVGEEGEDAVVPLYSDDSERGPTIVRADSDTPKDMRSEDSPKGGRSWLPWGIAAAIALVAGLVALVGPDVNRGGTEVTEASDVAIPSDEHRQTTRDTSEQRKPLVEHGPPSHTSDAPDTSDPPHGAVAQSDDASKKPKPDPDAAARATEIAEMLRALESLEDAETTSPGDQDSGVPKSLVNFERDGSEDGSREPTIEKGAVAEDLAGVRARFEDGRYLETIVSTEMLRKASGLSEDERLLLGLYQVRALVETDQDRRAKQLYEQLQREYPETFDEHRPR